jgi:1-phosphofructokinase family hexose kinase
VIVIAGFNSSVDKWMETDEVRIGGVSRVRDVRPFPGGKGLHVAVAVAELGERAHLVGIVDHRHHDFFNEFLRDRGVSFTGIAVDGELRTCIALRDAEGQITELLEPGPNVGSSSRGLLNQRFLELAREAPICVLSGSLPCGLPPATYRDLLTELATCRVRSMLDASGEALRLGIDGQPFLVKANRDETAALLGGTVDGPHAAAAATAALASEGIEFAVVSLGAEGAVATIEGQTLHARPPALVARNAVGAGDCLLAGIAVGLRRGFTPAETLRLGVACGAAKARNAETGFMRKADVDALLPQIELRNIGR